MLTVSGLGRVLSESEREHVGVRKAGQADWLLCTIMLVAFTAHLTLMVLPVVNSYKSTQVLSINQSITGCQQRSQGTGVYRAQLGSRLSPVHVLYVPLLSSPRHKL